MLRNAAAAMCLALIPVTSLAEGDAAKGERVFRKCKACHAVGPDAVNKVGPVLNGVVGSQVAGVEGFAYSKTLEEMGANGVVWDEETLTAFLVAPRKFAKGTKMSFAGLRKESEQADIIAYLATFDK